MTGGTAGQTAAGLAAAVLPRAGSLRRQPAIT
jgi:hypothetical protein